MENEYAEVTEGLATILYPKSDKVFYNPIQQFNRDLSVTAIKAWSDIYGSTKKRKRDESPTEPTGDRDRAPYIKIIEGLAASGLRSMRYAKEIPLVKTIIANDLSPAAVESIKRNAEHNSVADIVQPSLGDANLVMYSHRKSPVHVVDLDPYGTAAPFLDAAINSVVDNGILLVTCTDLAVLAGNGYPEKCFSLYGGTTVRNDATHESALRLLLNTVATTAARYGKAITPLLSLSIDYYIRCVIQIRTSPALVKQNLGKSGIVYNCTGCQTTHVQPLGKVTEPENGKGLKFGYVKGPTIGPICDHCDSPHHISGPLWTSNLHSPAFIAKMLEILETTDETVYPTLPRIRGMLSLAARELDLPFYVSPANMASKVRCPVPSLKLFINAVLNGGYKVSLTHAQAGCIKTDAPYTFLWDILRAWAKENRVKTELNSSPGSNILRKEASHEISFADNAASDEIEAFRKSKMAKFPQNPRAEWGPMARPSKKPRRTEIETS